MKAINYQYVQSLGFTPTEILYGIKANLRVDIHLGTFSPLKAALESRTATWPLGKLYAIVVLERTAEMETCREDVARTYLARA